MVLIDVFTRFIVLRCIPDKSAKETARALMEVFSIFGLPAILQSDNGLEFSNSLIQELCSAFFIDHRFISAYYPQSNGIAERAVQTTLVALRKELDGEGSRWNKVLPIIQLKINQRITTHDSSPFSIMFCRRLNYPGLQLHEDPAANRNSTTLSLDELITTRLNFAKDLLYPVISDKLTKVNIHKGNRWNRRHNIVQQFAVGALVDVQNTHPQSKFDLRYLGPYAVASVNQSGSYKLKDAVGNVLKRIFPISQLRISKGSSPTNRYYVEKIIDSKIVNNQRLFKVRWFGFESEDDSWEPKENFDDPTIVDNFLLSSASSDGSDVNTRNILE